ncbi:uncharacterized protein LOC126471140 isoform X5 [Schistocerca serialis cubense]|uniref:uncharacterized protein LOC126471140 isoform X5 n=1 Tax=Schistocerca serialis cubense TaxID=2023355 RepID=UPI00214E61DD|nr:uncharacterized protein LOC126471140 isoform X5 [Schistocerca serialis cubense]
MKIMKLKKGSRCMAKWLNTHFYYWCTIIEPVGEEWKVKFDDGTVAVVKAKDLHETSPAHARNPVRIVTRSTSSKNRKRPEEIRKSPARKVRKLFTEEENIRLGAKLSDVKENTTAAEKESIIESDLMEGLKDKESHENLTGVADVHPSSRERSVSVSKEAEDVKYRPSVADVHPSSRERSVSVSKEAEDVKYRPSVADVHPSSRERSVSVSKEAEDVKYRPSVADVHPSSRERSVSVSKEAEDVKYRPSKFYT